MLKSVKSRLEDELTCERVLTPSQLLKTAKFFGWEYEMIPGQKANCMSCKREDKVNTVLYLTDWLTSYCCTTTDSSNSVHSEYSKIA